MQASQLHDHTAAHAASEGRVTHPEELTTD